MKFKSKSETLKNLRLKKSIIPELIIFKCRDYLNNEKKIIFKISKKFKKNLIAIRSSFKNEDTKLKSNAGKYKSFLNVKANDYFSIKKSIDELIKGKKKLINEVFFVQKMIKKIKFSGVLLTRNLENYSKTININYYDGNETDVVTSGKGGSNSIEFYENKNYNLPNKFLKLYKAFLEIRNLTKENDLDIEFAIGKKKEVYILQVRKLIVPKAKVNKKFDTNYFFSLKKK